ncbi:hypothetical protein, partial [Nocardia beijingensis]
STVGGDWYDALVLPTKRTRRPLGREPGRERRMLGLASLERRGCGALGASVSAHVTSRAVEVAGGAWFAAQAEHLGREPGARGGGATAHAVLLRIVLR